MRFYDLAGRGVLEAIPVPLRVLRHAERWRLPRCAAAQLRALPRHRRCAITAASTVAWKGPRWRNALSHRLGGLHRTRRATYRFPGGNAIVELPAGFRPVPHWDRVHHRAKYYALACRLEDEERALLTNEKIADWCASKSPKRTTAPRVRRPVRPRTSWRASPRRSQAATIPASAARARSTRPAALLGVV
jgi:hypothetical protein